MYRKWSSKINTGQMSSSANYKLPIELIRQELNKYYAINLVQLGNGLCPNVHTRAGANGPAGQVLA